MLKGPIVLDGATGTELERRGVDAPLLLWSAGALLSHPDVVQAIHRDYALAGADVVVANTFRTNVRNLRAAGMLARGEELNRIAIGLARQASVPCHPERGEGSGRGSRLTSTRKRSQIPRCARNDMKATRNDMEATRNDMEAGRHHGCSVLVAASVAPVEDCYHPERVPGEAVLHDEHGQMLAWLKAAGPDLIWIETMGTVREARAAARAADHAQMPFVVSFVTREDGNLLGGEPLEQGVGAVEQFKPLAVGLNCIPPTGMTATLPRLRKATTLPLAAYAHINNVEPVFGWSYAESATPKQYAEHVKRWLDLGVSIVGGCCGTTPAHIRAVRSLIPHGLQTKP
jgi:S-methylmethionine-dependent homocysteine/selenocysteine methylase